MVEGSLEGEVTFIVPNHDVELTAVWKAPVYNSFNGGEEEYWGTFEVLEEVEININVKDLGGFVGYTLSPDTKNEVKVRSIGDYYTFRFMMPENSVTLRTEWEDMPILNLFTAQYPDGSIHWIDMVRYGVRIPSVRLEDRPGERFVGWEVVYPSSRYGEFLGLDPSEHMYMPNHNLAIRAIFQEGVNIYLDILGDTEMIPFHNWYLIEDEGFQGFLPGQNVTVPTLIQAIDIAERHRTSPYIPDLTRNITWRVYEKIDGAWVPSSINISKVSEAYELNNIGNNDIVLVGQWLDLGDFLSSNINLRAYEWGTGILRQPFPDDWDFGTHTFGSQEQAFGIDILTGPGLGQIITQETLDFYGFKFPELEVRLVDSNGYQAELETNLEGTTSFRLEWEEDGFNFAVNYPVGTQHGKNTDTFSVMLDGVQLFEFQTEIYIEHGIYYVNIRNIPTYEQVGFYEFPSINGFQISDDQQRIPILTGQPLTVFSGISDRFDFMGFEGFRTYLYDEHGVVRYSTLETTMPPHDLEVVLRWGDGNIKVEEGDSEEEVESKTRFLNVTLQQYLNNKRVDQVAFNREFRYGNLLGLENIFFDGYTYQGTDRINSPNTILMTSFQELLKAGYTLDQVVWILREDLPQIQPYFDQFTRPSYFFTLVEDTTLRFNAGSTLSLEIINEPVGLEPNNQTQGRRVQPGEFVILDSGNLQDHRFAGWSTMEHYGQLESWHSLSTGFLVNSSAQEIIRVWAHWNPLVKITPHNMGLGSQVHTEQLDGASAGELVTVYAGYQEGRMLISFDFQGEIEHVYTDLGERKVTFRPQEDVVVIANWQGVPTPMPPPVPTPTPPTSDPEPIPQAPSAAPPTPEPPVERERPQPAQPPRIPPTTQEERDLVIEWYHRHLPFINGFPDGTFRPNQYITNAEFATFAFRAFNMLPVDTTTTRDHWAQDYMDAIFHPQWLEFFGQSQYFNPDDPITRAQAITLLNHFTSRDVNLTSLDYQPGRFIDLHPTYWAYLDLMKAVFGTR